MKSRTKWILGLGCLPFLACGGFLAGLLGIVFGALSSSEPCRMTLAELNQSEIATDRLGSPIESGWLVTGHVNYRGQTGEAELAIPVSGPKGSGTANVEAVRVNGQWAIRSLSLSVAGQTVSLTGLEDMPAESAQEFPAEAPDQPSTQIESNVPEDKLPDKERESGDPAIRSAN